jgi:1-acyl-sn-glycerol-3-phosphate acyltransferase
MLRKVIRHIVGLLFKLLARVDVIGLENVPRRGGCILASNHLSRLDPALVFVLIKREDMTALVTDKYRRSPLIRPLVNASGGIWLHREEADIHALREARNFLHNGGLLGIAPEGTRSQSGALTPAKTGVAYLADKADVSIIPAAIYGTETALRQLLRFRRPKIVLQFGKPIRLPPVTRANREHDLQRNTDEIMCRIAAMLPPEYYGAYDGHPVLLALMNPTAVPETALTMQPELQTGR